LFCHRPGLLDASFDIRRLVRAGKGEASGLHEWLQTSRIDLSAAIAKIAAIVKAQQATPG
jgi:hypothetical protein